jgi:hypothetical protein
VYKEEDMFQVTEHELPLKAVESSLDLAQEFDLEDLHYFLTSSSESTPRTRARLNDWNS